MDTYNKEPLPEKLSFRISNVCGNSDGVLAKAVSILVGQAIECYDKSGMRTYSVSYDLEVKVSSESIPESEE